MGNVFELDDIDKTYSNYEDQANEFVLDLRKCFKDKFGINMKDIFEYYQNNIIKKVPLTMIDPGDKSLAIPNLHFYITGECEPDAYHFEYSFKRVPAISRNIVCKFVGMMGILETILYTSLYGRRYKVGEITYDDGRINIKLIVETKHSNKNYKSVIFDHHVTEINKRTRITHDHNLASVFVKNVEQEYSSLYYRIYFYNDTDNDDICKRFMMGNYKCTLSESNLKYLEKCKITEINNVEFIKVNNDHVVDIHVTIKEIEEEEIPKSLYKKYFDNYYNYDRGYHHNRERGILHSLNEKFNGKNDILIEDILYHYREDIGNYIKEDTTLPKINMSIVNNPLLNEYGYRLEYQMKVDNDKISLKPNLKDNDFIKILYYSLLVMKYTVCNFVADNNGDIYANIMVQCEDLTDYLFKHCFKFAIGDHGNYHNRLTAYNFAQGVDKMFKDTNLKYTINFYSKIENTNKVKDILVRTPNHKHEFGDNFIKNIYKVKLIAKNKICIQVEVDPESNCKENQSIPDIVLDWDSESIPQMTLDDNSKGLFGVYDVNTLSSSMNRNRDWIADWDGDCVVSNLPWETMTDTVDLELEDKKESKTEKKERGRNMKNLFGNLKMGAVEKKDLLISMTGEVAVKVLDSYYTYNGQTGELIDTASFNMELDGLLLIPTNVSDLSRGDIINYNNTYYYVINRNGNDVIVFDYSTNTKVTLVLAKNMFGLSFVSKLLNIYSSGIFNNGNDNMMGMNPMMLMMMMNKDDNKDMDMMDMMMLSSMMNGGNNMMNIGNGTINPLMLMMLNKDGDSNMSIPKAMMLSSMMNHNKKKNKKKKKKKDQKINQELRKIDTNECENSGILD